MKPGTLAHVLAFLLIVAAPVGEVQGSEGSGGGPVVLPVAKGASEPMPHDGFKALFVNDRFAGLDTFVIYLLQNDRLVQTKFLFPQKYFQSSVFLEDFTKVEGALREKYGNPVEAGEIWRSGTADDTAEPGKMIAVGELILKSVWDTADMVVVHTLRGENLDVDHEVNYISKHFTRGAAEAMREIRPRHFF